MKKDEFDLFKERNFHFDHTRTLKNWLQGFDARVETCESKLKLARVRGTGLSKIKQQLKVVKDAEKHCIANNGKTRNNVLTAAAKLNEMLCDLERAMTKHEDYSPECSFELRPIHCSKCGAYINALGTCRDEQSAFCKNCTADENGYLGTDRDVIWQPNYDHLGKDGQPITNIRARIK